MPHLFARQIAKLTMRSPAYRRFVGEFFDRTLAADLGTGDVTTTLLAEKRNKKITAIIRAKQTGIVAGLDECEVFWKRHRIRLTSRVADGENVTKGTIIAKLTGRAADILETERTALNLIGRMSGIATAMGKLIEVAKSDRIAATRKTPLGLIDCRAAVLGGGLPHRLNLADQILVKDNHLAVDPNCWKKITTTQSFEIEADTAAFALEVATYFSPLKRGVSRLQSGRGVALIILLDNFTPRELTKLVPRLRTINSTVTLEASGGITPKTVDAFLKTGVDYVSLGWLTHSSPALDVSLKIVS